MFFLCFFGHVLRTLVSQEIQKNILLFWFIADDGINDNFLFVWVPIFFHGWADVETRRPFEARTASDVEFKFDVVDVECADEFFGVRFFFVAGVKSYNFKIFVFHFAFLFLNSLFFKLLII